MSINKFLGSSHSSLLPSSIITIAAVLTMSEPALAVKSPSQVAQIAIPVTVQINSELGGGSGVIIDQRREGEETTYFVLTANHIVENPALNYEISTYTGITYSVSSVKHYQQTEKDPDLAVVTFQTMDYYPIARMGNSIEIELGARIAIFGYPGIGMVSNRPFIYSPGKLESLGPEPANIDWSYDAFTHNGMGGGPVFDQDGKLVAIHGKEGLSPVVEQYKKGTPIHTLIAIEPEFATNRRRASLDEAAVILGYGRGDHYAGASWFYCDTSGEVPQTIARNVLTNTSQALISWEGETGKKDCQEVSGRFQRAYYENRLNYLGVEEVNGRTIVCGLPEQGGSCYEHNKLMELEPGIDGVAWLKTFLGEEELSNRTDLTNLLAPLREQQDNLWW